MPSSADKDLMTSRKAFRDARVLVPMAIALFALSCIVRFLIADFPKGVGVIPDEIRYLDLASSLLNEGALIERGAYSSFQKILYPLSLIPAFLFEDAQVRMQVITILNCIYVSSAVFPALVIARRLFVRRAPILLCMLLTLLVPDMCYSMTFLSECVYLPLALWLIACCWHSLEKRGRAAVPWSAASGLLCYAAYLAKEVALGFALAFAVMLLVRIVRERDGRVATILSLAAFAAGLLLPFAIMKLTLFSGLLNSYNQADPSVLLNPYTVLFSLYALLSDATHFVMAFLFFPVLLPALTWPRLSRAERELYLFCVISFLFVLLAVVYTISIREDLGHVGIRPHVRYVAPIFLPLLFLMVKQLMRGDGASIMRNPLSFTAAVASTLAMAVLVLFMYGTGDYSQGFDSAQFHPLRLLGEWFDDVPVNPGADASSTRGGGIYHGDILAINPGLWMAKGLACAFLAFGLWALVSRRAKRGGAMLLVLIVAYMVAANFGAYQYNESVYRLDPEDASQYYAIDAFVDGLPDEDQVLFVYNDDNTAFNNISDAIVDNDRLNCSYIRLADFRELASAGVSQRNLLLATGKTMGDNIFGANGRLCDDDAGISHIILSAAHSIRLSSRCAEEVRLAGVEDIRVYRILPDSTIGLAPTGIERAAS